MGGGSRIILEAYRPFNAGGGANPRQSLGICVEYMALQLLAATICCGYNFPHFQYSYYP